MSRASAIHCAEDARRLARSRLPWMIFDYIDCSAGQGGGMERARRAFDEITLTPRILRDVSTRDLSKSIFDKTAKLPFGISPMAMCNLAAPRADLMLAKTSAQYDMPFGVSTASSTSLEELFEASMGNAWFQLYFSGDGATTFKLMKRAQAVGYKHLILTSDVPELGRRPRELQHGFKMPFRIGLRQFYDFAMHPYWSFGQLYHGQPKLANFEKPGFEFDRTESRARADWDWLDKLRSSWKGKLIVKGVLDIEDALQLKKRGVDAIQVSNHGSRQLESAPAAISALQSIRKALGDDFPIFYDSAIRSGEDILKAYESGADFVFLGRILQFAIAGAGEAGLTRLIDVISDEMSTGMAQIGRVHI